MISFSSIGNQFQIESPPRISRHIRADSETSSDMTPLISSRSSFNIHRDQTNSGEFNLCLIRNLQFNLKSNPNV